MLHEWQHSAALIATVSGWVQPWGGQQMGGRSDEGVKRKNKVRGKEQRGAPRAGGKDDT